MSVVLLSGTQFIILQTVSYKTLLLCILENTVQEDVLIAYNRNISIEVMTWQVFLYLIHISMVTQILKIAVYMVQQNSLKTELTLFLWGVRP